LAQRAPGAWDRSYNGGRQGDAIVVKLDSQATRFVYSSFLGGTGSDEALAGALLPSGALAVVGWTDSSDFPVTAGVFQSSYRGQREGFLAIESLLPVGVSRYGISTPWCSGPLAIDVDRMPQAGDPNFSLTCRGGPSSAQGILVLGSHQDLLGSQSLGGTYLGTVLHIAPLPPIGFLLASTDGLGRASVRLPIPAGMQGTRFFAQFGWPMPALCSFPYLLTSSDALDVTVQ
jgi:hypothetical protein